MTRYLFTFIFLSILIPKNFEDYTLDRIRKDFISREQLALDLSNYRDEDELIQFIESTMETHLIPGLSISIVKNNDIVWDKHFGYANIDENILVNANENVEFFQMLAENTMLAIASKESPEKIFMIQLPRPERAIQAFEIIKSGLAKCEK